MDDGQRLVARLEALRLRDDNVSGREDKVDNPVEDVVVPLKTPASPFELEDLEGR